MGPFFGERVPVRRPAGYRNNFGEWVEGTPATRTIRATYFPDGDARTFTAGGLRRTVKWTLLTPDPIRGLETGDEADEVEIGGVWLKVFVIRSWPSVGGIPAHSEVGALAGL